MATKPMNLNAGLEGLQTLVKMKGTILDRWLVDKQEWAPIAVRLPLGAIFFAHGAQKLFCWFGGYGWHGTMQYLYRSSLPEISPFTCRLDPSRAVAPAGVITSLFILVVPSQDAEAGFGG